ncbi:hypothetical protein VPH49_21965 [Pseudomonas luteola]|uniref:hypothetical protein n=1 Tax=Pseudomonas luteola TaxID=47886 RepID=UPI003A885B83
MNYVEDLLPETLIAAQGCPETIVERALRNSAFEFYRDSQSWRVVTDISPVIKGQRVVELELPADTVLVRLFWVKLDGKPLMAISDRNLSTDTGTPKGYAVSGVSHEIQMDVLPEATMTRNGVTAHMAVAPGTAADEIPDEMFLSHRSAILYGAIRYLLAIPNTPWSNLQDASVYGTLFNNEKIQAKRNAEAQQSAVVRKVRYGGL